MRKLGTQLITPIQVQGRLASVATVRIQGHSVLYGIPTLVPPSLRAKFLLSVCRVYCSSLHVGCEFLFPICAFRIIIISTRMAGKLDRCGRTDCLAVKEYISPLERHWASLSGTLIQSVKCCFVRMPFSLSVSARNLGEGKTTPEAEYSACGLVAFLSAEQMTEAPSRDFCPLVS